MRTALRVHQPVRVFPSQTSLTQGMVWGLIGGLVATLVMDLILMSALEAAGRPALSCFSIVGDTVARLISGSGSLISGNIPLGIAAHYLVGPLMGAWFGALAAKGKILRLDSRNKVIVSAVLFVEILSQPLLAMTPILLQMTAPETTQWFGGSLIMHLIWGCVLGVVWHWGVRLCQAGR